MHGYDISRTNKSKNFSKDFKEDEINRVLLNKA